MKNLLIVALIFAASTSQAATLKCWKSNFTKVNTPYMTAEISAAATLSNIQFLYKNSEVEDYSGSLQGKTIESNRSPYKGNAVYGMSNLASLILPTDLSEQNLQSLVAKGIGYYAGENAAILGQSAEGGEGGSHFSVRLICHSDLN